MKRIRIMEGAFSRGSFEQSDGFVPLLFVEGTGYRVQEKFER